jgi:hypothetical protein
MRFPRTLLTHLATLALFLGCVAIVVAAVHFGIDDPPSVRVPAER